MKTVREATKRHLANSETAPSDPASSMESYAEFISEALDALHESGVHPVQVAEAGLLATLPWLLEALNAKTIEAALFAVADRFEGNELRREH